MAYNTNKTYKVIQTYYIHIYTYMVPDSYCSNIISIGRPCHTWWYDIFINNINIITVIIVIIIIISSSSSSSIGSGSGSSSSSSI